MPAYFANNFVYCLLFWPTLYLLCTLYFQYSLTNFKSRPVDPATVSRCSRLSVEQSSIATNCCPLFLSISSAVVLNHISSHFLIPLTDSSFNRTEPAQCLAILDTLIVIAFNPYPNSNLFSTDHELVRNCQR